MMLSPKKGKHIFGSPLLVADQTPSSSHLRTGRSLGSDFQQSGRILLSPAEH
jgi:hypothetical protein